MSETNVNLKEMPDIKNGMALKGKLDELLCRVCVQKEVTVTVDANSEVACALQGLTQPGRDTFLIEYNNRFNIMVSGQLNKYDCGPIMLSLRLCDDTDEQGYQIYTVQDYLEIDSMYLQHLGLKKLLRELIKRNGRCTHIPYIDTELRRDLDDLRKFLESNGVQDRRVLVTYADKQFYVGTLPIEGSDNPCRIELLHDDMELIEARKCRYVVHYWDEFPLITITERMYASRQDESED